MSFDGTESANSNSRITNYLWDMGDGVTLAGPRVNHIFEEAGRYRVSLTVANAAGDTDTAETEVLIFDYQSYGSVQVRAVDENGLPIRGAYVFVYTAETDTERHLRTNSNGFATIVGSLGQHEIALYQDGFLPMRQSIEINSLGQNPAINVTLQSGEIVTGNMTVRKMDLAEMIYAGIDFNSGSNLHMLSFTVELTFAQEPIPTEIQFVSSACGGWSGSSGGFVGSSGSGGWSGNIGDSHLQIQPIFVQSEDVPEDEIIPILAYIRTTEQISFLKDMFAVELGVMNHASPEFVITDCFAKLSLPDGLSIAQTTHSYNTKTQRMWDIPGQQSSRAYWAISGDKVGEYHVSATFNGTLMPFEAPIQAKFRTENPFTVEIGSGLHLYIQPQEIGYIGEDYYIQYKLVNKGKNYFYNLRTSFGARGVINPGFKGRTRVVHPDGTVEMRYSDDNVDAFVIKGAPTESIPLVIGSSPPILSKNKDGALIPSLYAGQPLTIGVFPPDYAIYGTFVTKFEGEGDPEEVRYRLIDSMVKGLEHTNIQVHIQPIPSHISKRNVKQELVPSYFGDPIDMTTGAFVDTVPAMSVMGDSPLILNLNYNSLTANTISDKTAPLGFGWSHDFEAYLERRGGFVDVHWNETHFFTFKEDPIYTANVVGEKEGRLILELTGAIVDKFVPISPGMSEYSLSRTECGNYILTLPCGQRNIFNSEGELVWIIDRTEKTVSLQHLGNVTTITDEITGAKMHLHHNIDGHLTVIRDDNGRMAKLTYENGLLTTVTNAAGDTVSYVYDENRRLIRAFAGDEKMPFLVNEYDNANRVVRQVDARGSVTTFKYENSGGIFTATAVDRNENTIKFISDMFGRVLEINDQNGNITSYQYDRLGNVIAETNGNGDTIEYIYNGLNLTQIIDYSGNVTRLTYDENRNITSVIGANKETSIFNYNARNLLVNSVENSGVIRNFTYNEHGQILSESVDGLGTQNYEYQSGRIVSISDFMGNKTLMTYDIHGNLQSVTDRDGNEISYSYDALNRPTRITSADGTVSFTYDHRGNQTSVTDTRGNTTHYVYNENNSLTAETNPLGQISSYIYDKEDRLIRVVNPAGAAANFALDAVGNILKATDANGNEVKFGYDKVDQVTSKTWTVGEIQYQEIYEYFPNGKPKKTIFADKTFESYEYDKSWRLVKVTNHLGHATVMKYDANGNLLSVTDPEDNITSYTYDIFGRVTSSTDPNGNITKFNEYDANGNSLKVTMPNGLTVNFEYSDGGFLTKIITGNRSVSYKYDSAGRVISYTDEEGHTFRTVYDKAGNVLRLIDAKGNTVQENQYNELNQRALATDAEGISASFEYDNVGRLIRQINALNTERQTQNRFSYDKIGQLLSTTDAMSGIAAYEYDEVGNAVKIADPGGGISQYSYDGMGRTTEFINALGSKTSYSYNAAGLLDKVVNPRGLETTFTYLQNGWISSFTDELGTVFYTYDANGNVLTVEDENGTITREYDEMNRVTSHTDFRKNTIKYGYDQFGNIVSIEYPGGRIVKYDYYKTGALKSVTDWDGGVTRYSYDENGRLTRISRPDGSVEGRVCDLAGRLIMQHSQKGSEVIHSQRYTYDAAGNIATVSLSNPSQFVGTVSARMEYNEFNQLIK